MDVPVGILHEVQRRTVTSPGLGLGGGSSPQTQFKPPEWMSAHLVSRATIHVGVRYSVHIQLDYVQRLAYPIRTLELVMANAIPLSELASEVLADDTRACRPLV